jgi:hypothetical protein
LSDYLTDSTASEDGKTTTLKGPLEEMAHALREQNRYRTRIAPRRRFWRRNLKTGKSVNRFLISCTAPLHNFPTRTMQCLYRYGNFTDIALVNFTSRRRRLME